MHIKEIKQEECFSIVPKCWSTLTKLRYTQVTPVEVVHVYLRQNVAF